ncbi:MAG TPA: fumarylacetoacetate hydrolase family protein [Xanthobacteraceae bacterium]|jgi:2-keto-4-pentenoate hydratase/2-oxohepta-3-ene-1,7-dioic acid hydratase in catechol pathway|nr:fumarylacetoacetate hydrolase family protein [Xanthobacteraceae bacterium]
MIFCRFRKSDFVSYGIIEDDVVRVIEGEPFGQYGLGTKRFPLREVELLVPVIPGTFYAIGSNYHNHVVGRAKVKGREPIFYQTPRVGYRANSALLAHEADIVKPADAGPRFEYEAELVAVIGKPARKVSPSEAAECIFGWTIGNDLTERDWQAKDPTNLRGKNADTFKPMGPWIVTGLELRDMTTNVKINGRLAHSFPTANMLFSPGEVVSDVSRYNTLSPGDVVWLGTDEVPETIKPGDLIEIEITGIGVLRNRVMAEA